MGDMLTKFKQYRPQWDWANMRGSQRCLKWNLQDLAALDRAMALTPGRAVAVQAGGNLGIFPKRLAEEFKLVYTFEPDPGLFACLEYNASESNIVPIQVALGNSNEPVSLDCRRRDGSGRDVHEGLTHVSGGGDIPQLRLDEFDLPACDLIYLDIEGYEYNALCGAERTIARFHPTLALEVNGNTNHYGASKQELRGWVESRGYVRRERNHGDDIYTYAGATA
jgi:FkbM family methyltransferase